MGIMCNNLFPPLLPVSLIDSQDTQITGFIRYMFVWLRFHSFRSLLVNTHTLYSHMKRERETENQRTFCSFTLCVSRPGVLRMLSCIHSPNIYFSSFSSQPLLLLKQTLLLETTKLMISKQTNWSDGEGRKQQTLDHMDAKGGRVRETNSWCNAIQCVVQQSSTTQYQSGDCWK